MKGRVVVIDHIDGREAAALVVDGRLEDLLIDPAEDPAMGPGAICRAVADRLVKGQGGVFVRLPGGMSGFLRQTAGIGPGRRLIVQVSGSAEPGKALPVTRRVIFKGRLAIVTPGAGGFNLSRRIRETDRREELAAIAAGAMAGAAEDLGVILRSGCEVADAEEIATEIGELRALAEAVMADEDGEPELLVAAPGAHERAWREWSEPAPDAVEQGEGAFAAFGVDEMIDAALDPVVPLGGGASMTIEPTRALVAVDVNTGGDTSPAAGLKADIAAARALARELRIRGLGGQIVVDFAPVPRNDRVRIEQVLGAMFRNDGSETSLAGWTALGLFELQRKRDRPPLAALLADEGA